MLASWVRIADTISDAFQVDGIEGDAHVRDVYPEVLHHAAA
jgi:hypothetical protein